MEKLVISSIKEFEKWVTDNECIYLYGAGKVCKKILKKIELMGMSNHIAGILVTHKNDIDGISGVQVKQYNKDVMIKNSVILRAVSKKYQDEIETYLKENKVCDAVGLSDDFESKLDRNLLMEEIKCNVMKIAQEGDVSRDKRDMMFITPPFWDAYSPFSAVPCLLGKIKEAGYTCEQYDIGIYCIHYLINKKWEEYRKFFLSKEFYQDKVKKYEKNVYKNWDEYKAGMKFLQETHFDFMKVKKEYKDFNAVQKRVLDSFYSAIYSCTIDNFDFDKCNNLEEEVKTYKNIELFEVLCAEELCQIFKNTPDIVGISITSLNQFVPGCILADLIKTCNPNVKIIMGGSCADLFANSRYICKVDIKKYFDYIIIGEGETAIVQLIGHIKHDAPIDGIPNLLLFNKQNEIYYTEQIVEDVKSLPIPDYTGVKFELYLSPETILPYQTSRGCHYGQCAFCNHDEKYRHNYRSKNMKKVVSELLYLSSKYNVRNFQFVDEAIRPDCFKEMIDEMSKNKEFKQINWFYYSRVSRQYDQDTLIKARENGCKMVMFGIETLNQRLLKLIKKGIHVETSKYCLKLFHETGIKTFAWLMCNLPTETIEEATQDLEDIKSLSEYIDAFAVGRFMLLPNTDMYAEPEKYNITYIDLEDPCKFISHNNTIEIDNDSMYEFFNDNYLNYQEEKCFITNRYTIFFEDSI